MTCEKTFKYFFLFYVRVPTVVGSAMQDTMVTKQQVAIKVKVIVLMVLNVINMQPVRLEETTGTTANVISDTQEMVEFVGQTMTWIVTQTMNFSVPIQDVERYLLTQF